MRKGQPLGREHDEGPMKAWQKSHEMVVKIIQTGRIQLQCDPPKRGGSNWTPTTRILSTVRQVYKSSYHKLSLGGAKLIYKDEGSIREKKVRFNWQSWRGDWPQFSSNSKRTCMGEKSNKKMNVKLISQHWNRRSPLIKPTKLHIHA